MSSMATQYALMMRFKCGAESRDEIPASEHPLEPAMEFQQDQGLVTRSAGSPLVVTPRADVRATIP